MNDVGRPELLEAAVAASDDGLFAFDAELRLSLWSPAMARIFGLGAGDVVGRIATQLFPYLVETGQVADWHAALEGDSLRRRGIPFEVPGTGRAGALDLRLEPLWDGTHQRIVGAIGIARDVTDREEIEQRIQETEMRFQNMADAAPVMLWMARTDGLCTFFNSTWLRFTGRSLEDEWGVGWAEGVHFEDLRACLDTYAEAFSKRRMFEMEYRLRRQDGVFRWILDRGAPRYRLDGAFAGYIGSCTDITEKKEHETGLVQEVKVRDEFLSIASHELRTPVAALQLQMDSLARIIERRGEEALRTGKLAESTRQARAAAGRLGDLLEVLLDVSRITEGRLLLQPREGTALDLLVRAAAERLRPAAEEAGSPLELDLDPGAVGRWDPVRLEQVVTNLLANAIKFGDKKPVSVRVALAGSGVRLQVCDQGAGIPPEDQDRIFERFARAVPARHFAGLGLGLWIVRQLVEAHGGKIHVDSAPGAGATFVVDLPREPELWTPREASGEQ